MLVAFFAAGCLGSRALPGLAKAARPFDSAQGRLWGTLFWGTLFSTRPHLLSNGKSVSITRRVVALHYRDVRSVDPRSAPDLPLWRVAVDDQDVVPGSERLMGGW